MNEKEYLRMNAENEAKVYQGSSRLRCPSLPGSLTPDMGPRESGKVINALEYQNDALDRLSRVIQTLEAKLQPALSPIAVAENRKNAGEGPASVLVNRIGANNQIISEMVEYISHLTDRVEL